MMWMTLALLACGTSADPTLSPEERIVALRFEKKAALDELYAAYGGGSAADFVEEQNGMALQELAKEDAQVAEAAKGWADALTNTVKGADREMFEADCLRLGEGHNVSFFTNKAKAFFEQPSSVNACRDIAKKARDIAKLQQAANAPG